MPAYAAEVTIAATPEHVFDHLTRPELLVRWVGGLEASRPLSVQGLVPGARSEETVRDRGRLIRMVSTVREVMHGERLVVGIENPSGEFTATYTLAPSRGGTLLHHRLDARYRGALRLFAPLFRGPVVHKLASDLARLRAECERTDVPHARA